MQFILMWLSCLQFDSGLGPVRFGFSLWKYHMDFISRILVIGPSLYNMSSFDCQFPPQEDIEEIDASGGVVSRANVSDLRPDAEPPANIYGHSNAWLYRVPSKGP